MFKLGRLQDSIQLLFIIHYLFNAGLRSKFHSLIFNIFFYMWNYKVNLDILVG